MANFTGANVITTSDVLKYQPDAFDFGISTTATETTNFLVCGSQKLTYRSSNYRFLYLVTVISNYSIVYANRLFRPISLYFRKHTFGRSGMLIFT